MASVLATVIVVIADRRFTAGRRTPLGPFGRILLVWVAVFVVLALVLAGGDRSGLAVVLVPFLGATVVAGAVELARRALGRG